jgi:Fe-S-cluster-containing dehydrogenase component
VANGMNTACVDVCPTDCLIFGDLDDPKSPVSLALKENDWYVLAPEAGTKPQLYFLK